MHKVIQVEKGRAGIHRKHNPLNLNIHSHLNFSISFPRIGTKENRVVFYLLDGIENQARGEEKCHSWFFGILFYDQNEKGD